MMNMVQHKLLTKELEKKLPKLYSTQNVKDPVAIVRFFHPYSHWEWYATEYDPKQRTFFGLVRGDMDELGYFTLDELESTVVHGLHMERDAWFKPTNLSVVKKEMYKARESKLKSEREKNVVISDKKKKSIEQDLMPMLQRAVSSGHFNVVETEKHVNAVLEERCLTIKKDALTLILQHFSPDLNISHFFNDMFNWVKQKRKKATLQYTRRTYPGEPEYEIEHSITRFVNENRDAGATRENIIGNTLKDVKHSRGVMINKVVEKLVKNGKLRMYKQKLYPGT